MPPFENEDAVAAGLFACLDLVDDEGSLNGPARSLPLIGVFVKAEVVDFIAQVKLSQCYQNNRSDPVEAIYHFPVDEAACVCDFVAEYDDGTTVKGNVKEKDEAKKEYREAMKHGRQANLLETVRGDVFSLNVGNFPPGGHLKITVTYVTCLKAEDDAAAFILPTCVAPRYSPRTERVEVDEAQALAPPHSAVKFYGLDVDVNLKTHSVIKSITCPSHSCERSFSSEIRGNRGSASFSDIAMDRDLVLIVREDKAHQPRACVEVSDDGSIAGFVTIFPKIEFQDAAREIIFVIDRSGSMGSGGARGKTQIQQASDALLLFLRSLPSSCTFNIVGFGSRYESLFSQAMPFNDKTFDEASGYARKMDASFGGTEIMAPLDYVFKQKLVPGLERQIFVLTDGQVSNDLQVFNLIRENCFPGNKGDKTAKCRLFALGIGAGVSRHLVTGMAGAGHGTAHFVEGGDEISLRSKVLGQLKQALQPALDDVSIQWSFASTMSSGKLKAFRSSEEESEPFKTLLGFRGNSSGDEHDPVNLDPLICPTNVPPIFNQERFLSFVLFPVGMKDIPESVTIKCESPDGPLETTLDISDKEVFHGSIAHKMAAREVIREFENSRKGRGHFLGNGRMGSRISSSTISRAEALKLALQNKLASEQTSFIAVLEKPVVEAGIEAEKQVIPQYFFPSYNAENLEKERQECFRSASPSMANRRYRSLGTTFQCGPSISVFESAPVSAGVWRSAKKTRRKAADVFPGSGSTKKKSGVPFQSDHGISRSFMGHNGSSMKHSSCPPKHLPSQHFPTLTSSTSPAAPSHVKAMQRERAAPLKHHRKERVSSDDALLNICLLQRANGSFALSDDLMVSLGLTPEAMKFQAQILDSNSSLDSSVVFATLLAVAAMRKRFASKRDIWELQENKALVFIHKQSGLSDNDIETVISKLLTSL